MSIYDARYIVPPECAGQIVEVAYASDDEWIYERTIDRSDGELTYRRAPWEALDADAVCEPWNEAPAVPATAWEEIAQ